MTIWVLVFVAGCGPSATAVRTAAAQTEAAVLTQAAIAVPTAPPAGTAKNRPSTMPATTATAVRLSAINLEPLLIEAGDLPAGYSGTQAQPEAPQMFDTLPKADLTLYEQFAVQGQAAGGVAVFLFSDPGLVAQAYKIIQDGFGSGAENVSGIGELANSVNIDLSDSGHAVDLVFRRCAAVVHIRMAENGYLAEATAYAKRLDARLKPLVCH